MNVQMLKAIADGLLQIAGAVQVLVDEYQESLGRTPDEKAQPPVSAPAVPAASAPVLLDEPKKIGIVELRAFVAEKSTPETRPIIKEILTQHGVKKLTELKEEQYPSVMEAVRKACK